MIRLLTFFCLGLFPTLILAFSIKPAFPQGMYDLPTPVPAPGSKGIQVIDAKTGIPMRLGVKCDLELYGDPVHDGLCNIGRKARVSVIDIGSRTYRIVRSAEDDARGTFYFGMHEIIGPVTAQGDCWVGPKVKFCAN